MILLANNLAFSLFVPQARPAVLAAYIGVCLALGIGFIFLLTAMPTRFRRPIVIATTFILGLFYFLEFMFPGRQMAPLRDRLAAAESGFRTAQQDLYAVVVQRNDVSARLAHAGQALNDAARSLDKAAEMIDRVKPDAEEQLRRAAEDASRWAKARGVPGKVLEFDAETGSISDIRTQTYRKRVGDLAKAAEGMSDARAAMEKAQSVSASTPPKEVDAIRGSLAAGADSLALARSNLSDNFLSPYTQPVGDVSVVIGAFALGLGIYGLAAVHAKAISGKRPGWLNSLAFYVAMIAMTLVGFLKDYLGKRPAQSLSESVYNILFYGALNALSATMFSLVAFYIVSAAYRAFRVKSGESALMMASAFLVMLSLVPFGVLITSGLPVHGWASIFRLENIGHWILLFPNAAAQRGMFFGIGVGGLAMALRVWLSLERGSYFDKEM